MMRYFRPFCAAAVVLVVAGCGGSGDSSGESGDPSDQTRQPSQHSQATSVSYLPKEAFAVIVVHVQAALRWMEHENVKIPNSALGHAKSEFGVDVRNIRELVIPMAPDDSGPMAVLMRFNKPYDKDRLGGERFHRDDPESVEYGGVQYLQRSEGEMRLCFVDGTTVIFGPAPGVRKMLDSAASDTPLAKTVAGMSAEHVVSVVADLTGAPPAVQEMLEDAPPDIAELVKGGKIAMLKAWFDLEPEARVGLSVSTEDAESVKTLRSFIEQGLAQAAEMLGAEVDQILLRLPPGFEREHVDFLKHLHGAVKLTTRENRVDVTVKIPGGFPRIVRTVFRELENVENVSGAADVNVAKVQIAFFKAPLRLYRMDTKVFPTTEQGLQTLITPPTDAEESTVAGWDGPYLNMDALPKDPWGNDYQYAYPPENGNSDFPDIWSFGPDQEDGTEDDICSWHAGADTGEEGEFGEGMEEDLDIDIDVDFDTGSGHPEPEL